MAPKETGKDTKPAPPKPPVPPSPEPKSERFNMFISPSEIKEIDEWAWENRIRSKSDAVRRLVQIGLIFDKNAAGLAEAMVELYEGYGAKALSAAQELDGPEETREERVGRYVSKTLELSIETSAQISHLLYQLNLVMQPAQVMKADERFEAAQFGFLAAQADSLAKLLQQKIEIFELKKAHGMLPEDSSREADK